MLANSTMCRIRIRIGTMHPNACLICNEGGYQCWVNQLCSQGRNLEKDPCNPFSRTDTAMLTISPPDSLWYIVCHDITAKGQICGMMSSLAPLFQGLLKTATLACYISKYFKIFLFKDGAWKISLSSEPRTRLAASLSPEVIPAKPVI